MRLAPRQSSQRPRPKTLHMTQQQLAAASGIRQSEISRIESGHGNPTLKTIGALARALGAELRIASFWRRLNLRRCHSRRTVPSAPGGRRDPWKRPKRPCIPFPPRCWPS